LPERTKNGFCEGGKKIGPPDDRPPEKRAFEEKKQSGTATLDTEGKDRKSFPASKGRDEMLWERSGGKKRNAVKNLPGKGEKGSNRFDDTRGNKFRKEKVKHNLEKRGEPLIVVPQRKKKKGGIERRRKGGKEKKLQDASML